MMPDERTQPVAIHEIEVTESWDLPRAFPPAYRRAQVLVRCQRRPVGVVQVVLHDGELREEDLAAAIDAQPEIARSIETIERRAMLLKHHPQKLRPPSWSLIICTRDRPEDLQRCLSSLMAADGIEAGEVLIVDNAPSDDATKQLVAQFPFRYIQTPRAGQNHARATGARAASGDVLLFTDDDTVVDRHWLSAMLGKFDSPRVGAATGLTLPMELETEAQHLFQRYGGHGRGFVDIVHDRNTLPPAAAGRMGNGANMAIRRDLVVDLELFDTELDGGTAAMSGGDTYALFRVLAGGYQIAYTPEALIWHRDRREMAALKRMLYGYSVGVFAVLSRALCKHHETDAARVGWSWLCHHHIKQTLRALLRRPGALPLKLLWPEWKGVCVGPAAYVRTRRRERERARGGAA